jgi:hypothetical protein
MAKVVNPTGKLNMTRDSITIRRDAEQLARKLFKNNKSQVEFVNQLLGYYAQAEGKDVLIIHNPGGWGSTDTEHLIYWEASVVDGVKVALTKMERNWILLQHFRSGRKWWNHLRDTPGQIRYYLTGKFFKAKLLAAELNFLSEHVKNLDIFLLGVSHGAAFGNTVMEHTNNNTRIYSIELGTFFAHLPRRVITERTLALDGNGLVPDPVVHFNFKAGIKAYLTAPFRWISYRVAGKPVKFTYCINVPGHEYRWEYPNVGTPIEKFLATNLGYKYKTSLEK